jgi:hypothetical protein
MAAPDDLSKLDNLEADSIDSALKARFQQDNIYTSINTLLVALNPYKQIPGIYSQETLTSYTEYAALARKPHVYTVAGNAYRGLLESRSQSLVISGESGAGVRARACALLAIPPSRLGKQGRRGAKTAAAAVGAQSGRRRRNAFTRASPRSSKAHLHSL